MKNQISIGQKQYDPEDEIGIRSMLVNQMGVGNDDIGWREGKESGTVTVKGNDFMTVGSENLRNGSSFTSADNFNNAIENYSQMFGFDFQGMNNNVDSANVTKSSLPFEKQPQQTDYVSPYSDELDAIYQQITNYDYDPSSDASYKALENRYQDMGQQAMRDVLGKASSLTGGRLNSHAQMASQDAYDDYLGELVGMIPQLEQQGLSKLYDKFNATQSLDNTGYNRFSDKRNYDLDVSQHNETMDYNKARDLEQDKWKEKTYNYGVERDEANDAWNQKNFDYQVDSDEESRFWDNFWHEKDYNLSASRSTGSSSNSTPPSNTKSTPEQISNYEEIRRIVMSGESRYGSDSLTMIKKLAGDKEHLSGRMGEELFEELFEEARGYSQETPTDEVYVEIVKSFEGMTNEEILDELDLYKDEYKEHLGPDRYEDLVNRFKVEEVEEKEPNYDEGYGKMLEDLEGLTSAEAFEKLMEQAMDYLPSAGNENYSDTLDYYREDRKDSNENIGNDIQKITDDYRTKDLSDKQILKDLKSREQEWTNKTSKEAYEAVIAEYEEKVGNGSFDLRDLKFWK